MKKKLSRHFLTLTTLAVLFGFGGVTFDKTVASPNLSIKIDGDYH